MSLSTRWGQGKLLMRASDEELGQRLPGYGLHDPLMLFGWLANEYRSTGRCLRGTEDSCITKPNGAAEGTFAKPIRGAKATLWRQDTIWMSRRPSVHVSEPCI